MIRLYLIRHGETDWNFQKRFQGWTDIELNEKGHEQAELLGSRFKEIPVDKIYASPLKRAMSTAEAIARVKNTAVIPVENFKEINFGEWEGMTVPQLYEKYGEVFDKFMKKPEEEPFPGDISFANVTRRIEEGLAQVLAKEEDRNIVIVSHGGIVRLMICLLMQFSGDFYNKTWIDNTSISVVELRAHGNVLRMLNDCSHAGLGII